MILDDENILMSDIKEKMDNPFYSIREIFIQAEKENNCILHPYKKDIVKLKKIYTLSTNTCYIPKNNQKISVIIAINHILVHSLNIAKNTYLAKMSLI